MDKNSTEVCYEELDLQEKKLEFEKFSRDDALAIGLSLYVKEIP